MERNSNLDGFYSELANRFGALSRLFGQLSSPKATEELIDGLTSEEGAAFRQFTDRLDIPILGKCFWVREIIERVVITPTGLVEECWLRDDLTRAELLLSLQIALRHRQLTPIARSMEVILYNGRAVIPPGAFLDELKANGLVTCEMRMTYDTSTRLALSKPEQVCI